MSEEEAVAAKMIGNVFHLESASRGSRPEDKFSAHVALDDVSCLPA